MAKGPAGRLERTLAQGEPSAIALATLQTSLDDEEDQPLFEFGIRGERALMDRFLSAVDSGDFTRTQLRSAGFAYTDVLFWNSAPTRAIQLRFDNRAERIALLPAEEQFTEFQRLEADSKNLPLASRMLVPAILRVATACLSGRARLRCASAALGCERYRLVRGKWPVALEELVPAFLRRLPIDPFDGKPIRFCRASDHVVIYSVGADCRDDGGRTETVPPSTAGRDLEFRLWNSSSREPRAVRVDPLGQEIDLVKMCRRVLTVERRELGVLDVESAAFFTSPSEEGAFFAFRNAHVGPA